MPSRRLAALAILTLIGLSAAPARADIDFPLASIQAEKVMAGVQLCGLLDSDLSPGATNCQPKTGRRTPGSWVAGAGPRGAHTAAPRNVSTAYPRSPAVTEKVKRQFVDFARKQAPAEAAVVEAELRRSDLTNEWSRVVADDGLRSGDVADVFASYWLLNWTIATHGEDTRTQALAVREQVRRMLVNVPAFANLDLAGRQEMAEALILNFVYQGRAWAAALRQGDQSMQARLGAAATERFRREMGIDLRALALTDHGFVKRG